MTLFKNFWKILKIKILTKFEISNVMMGYCQNFLRISNFSFWKWLLKSLQLARFDNFFWENFASKIVYSAPNGFRDMTYLGILWKVFKDLIENTNRIMGAVWVFSRVAKIEVKICNPRKYSDFTSPKSGSKARKIICCAFLCLSVGAILWFIRHGTSG